MTNIKEWANRVGIAHIKDGVSEDRMQWAIDIVVHHPDRISKMAVDEICDLLLIFNAWYLFLKKELAIVKASSYDSIRREALFQVCDALKTHIESLKAVYNGKCYERKINAFNSR